MKKSLSRLHLAEELHVAVKTICSGFGLLQQSAKATERNVFLVLLVLSTSFERLLKGVLCLHSMEESGEPLSESELRRFGHDLSEISDAVFEKGLSPSVLKRPAAREDAAFIENDEVIGGILDVLSDFAVSERYLHLDGVNDPSQDRDWLWGRWESIEELTMPEDEYLRLVGEGEIEKLRTRTGEVMIAKMERFLRAVMRTLYWSDKEGEQSGGSARSIGTEAFDFLALRDEELGQTRYEVY